MSKAARTFGFALVLLVAAPAGAQDGGQAPDGGTPADATPPGSSDDDPGDPPGTGADADADPDPAPDAAADADADAAEPDADSDRGAGEDPEPASDTDADPGPDEDAGTEPSAEADADETEPQGDADAESLSEEDAELSEDDADAEDEAESSGYTFGARINGEYRHRFVALSDFPLEPLPRDATGESRRYGANAWGEQWLRLRGELSLRPILRLVGEADILWGVAYGDLASGMGPAAWTREEYGYPGLRLRQLYLEWLTPVGVIRVGQQAFSWGLGIVSNGGSTAPVFGDYRYGDLVRRLLFATRPAGADSPFTIAVAGDWVAWDLIADFDGREDLAFQGLLAAYYEEGDNRAGGYVAYRNQTDAQGETLEVFVGDLFANLHFDEPSGGRILTAFEIAYIRGTTTITRTVEFPTQDVEQLLAAFRLGRVSTHFDLILEGGYSSGDSNAEDGWQRRGTFDPDHRVGLIMFPEVLAAMSARTAALAASGELFGRPSRGNELLPTNGGVSGAYYFFPYAKWRPLEWFEGRLGAVVGWTSTDNVDPFQQRSRSANVNHLGGDPTRRDLGLELDGSILLSAALPEDVRLSGGVEGGIFFPGNAFDDAEGRAMEPVGMVRARLGISY